MQLLFSGVAATLEPANPVVPKNTPAGVGVRVSAGGEALSSSDAAEFFGGAFQVLGELSGPGLGGAITLESDPADPLLLLFPPLPISGDYALSNVRIVVGGKPVLDVGPSPAIVQVIEQVLITSVKTRPLTLDELKEKGVIFDGDDFLGFEFSIGMLLESKPVDISFPVVFDRQGVQVPQPLSPLMDPQRQGVSIDLPPLPTIVPFMLETEDLIELPEIELPDGTKEAIRIPSVLVIPGNVGFLKQFFSAQLFVANGAPGGSGLTVRDVTGTIVLPPGDDLVLGTADDPLALPELVTGTQPETLTVKAVGPDGEPGTTDDKGTLGPGEQGQAEFLVRGEKEGFHTLSFDIRATLEGLATGPVRVKGLARGAVLVRNPFFDMTFTVPSVVRAQEPFKLFVTVNNIGEGIANQVDVSFNDRALSGLRIGDGASASMTIDTLLPGDSKTLVYDFVAERTGQVVASYLRFDGEPAADGRLNFTLGVDERGVPLSPDTLVLPSSIDTLPTSLTNAAMRVLGQAWSVANAPSGTLPPDVTRIRQSVVIEKALALAEAGLRVELGEAPSSAVRGIAFDFYGGDPLDVGFDQLLHTTDAGSNFAAALGAELETAMTVAGGTVGYERETALIAASGHDFLSVAVGSTDVAVTTPALPGIIPLANSQGTLGILTKLEASTYEVGLVPLAAGSVELSLTLPRGDGTFTRGSGSVDLPDGSRARIVADIFRPDELVVEIDTDDDGSFDSQIPLATESIVSQGPNLLAAAIFDSNLLDGASDFGFHGAALFDRVVDEASASDIAKYTIPNNSLKGARRQLSGRMVFLTFERPEGPYVATTLQALGITDLRGVSGPGATVPVDSRLADPGAVVTGRVFEADGTPVSAGNVAYANYRASSDCTSAQELVFAEAPLGPDGSYAFRYVRQDPCGSSFRMIHVSPRTGELRDVTAFVRTAGERINLDLALFGRGAVTGIVTENGQPAPGASVVVVSSTDPQSGGAATTDGDGRFIVFDLVVGPVSVKAARGISVGANSGRIARAGTTAEVNVVLDPGKVRVSGIVSKLEDGETTSLPGAQVVYAIDDPNTFNRLPVAVTRTAADGSYALEDLPFGNFELEAILDFDTRASITGSTSPGEDRVENIVIPITPLAELGTVRGRVQLPDTSPAAGAIVRVENRGVVADENGNFEIPGIPVRPGVSQLVLAITQDGKRQGRTSVVISTSGQIVEGILLTLSGLGSLELTVRDVDGAAVPNQLVGLLGGCASSCGCTFGTTDGNGIVAFSEVSPGTHFAKAVFIEGNFVDVGVGSVRVEKDGDIGRGLIEFAGAGTVTGTVYLPGGTEVAAGADVELVTQVFNRDACELRSGLSHRGRTNALGQFSFGNVNVGRVSATAFHPFLDTRVGDTATLTSETPVDFTLELVDTTAGTLSGTVFLPDGFTPAGAGVEITAVGPLPEITVRTDDSGRYAFAPIFPEGMYILTVQDAVTGGLAQERLFLRKEEDAVHDFRMKGRGTVSVRVVDALGAPVPNAFVKLTESEYPRGEFEGAIEPASDGVVTFTNVFEGPFSVEAVDVFGRDGGRVPSVLPGPGATIDLEVRLNAVGTVTGHFRMPGGAPIPFGVVKLLSGGVVIGQTTSRGAGDVGRFTFDFVPIGSVRLEAQDPLTARLGFATGTLAAQGEALELDVQAQGLGRVEGVVTANGMPQDGAHVDLVSGTFRACTTADPNGLYFIEGVPEGRIVATASLGSGFLTGTNSATLIGDGTTLTLDVALRDSATVTGRVLKAATIDVPGAPSLVTITVGGAGGARQSTTSDPADGSFRFERVPAGLATIDVEALGSLDRAKRVVDVLPGGLTDFDVPLNGISSVRVQLADSNGDPTAGRLGLRGTGDFRYELVVDVASNGEVIFPEVLAGPVTASLTVDGPTRLFGATSGLALPDEELQLLVQVEPSGTVRGLVRRSDLEPAVGASVFVELSANRGVISTQTNVDGEFEVEGIPLGEFDIRVEDPFTIGVGFLLGVNMSANGQIIENLVIDLDASPVEVVGVDPPDGAVDILVNQPVTVTFSDPVFVLNSAIRVKNGNILVSSAAALAPDGLSATLNATLPDSTVVTVEVTTALVDVFGRRPNSVFTSSFRTVDLSPPRAIATEPADGAFEVGSAPVVLVTFDEPVADTTDFTSLISLVGPSGAVPGVSERAATDQARFTPSVPLEDNGAFDIVVNGAIDELGNTQTQPATVATFATHDTVAPELSVITPLPNAWVRLVTPSIQLGVTDNASGIDAQTGSIRLDGVLVESSVGVDRLFHTPQDPLAEGPHTYEAAIADRVGNIGSFSGSFNIDFTPPEQAVVTSPAPGTVLTGVTRFSATATDALSGVARIDLRRSGALFTSLLPPTFEADFDASTLPEGDATITARAFDVAGNAGAESEGVPVRIDADPLFLNFTQPQVGLRVRDSVTAAVSVSEPTIDVEFSIGPVSVIDDTSPFSVALDLASVPEGTQTITATGNAVDGSIGSATRDIVIDRTPPTPPDPALVTAEPPQLGASLVHSAPGSVEANALIDATNLTNAATASTMADTDGAFFMSVTAEIGDVISLVATDDLGNVGVASQVVVQDVPTLPPPASSTQLRFDGVLVDRVGPNDLVPDGDDDAVFSVDLMIGDGITRTLSHIELQGPQVRSTQSTVGGSLGVALSAGGSLENDGDGEVSFDITDTTALTLFAADDGLVMEGQTYTVKIAFTDGGEFIATTTFAPPSDATGVPHSLRMSALPSTLQVPSDGTTLLTIEDIRDIEGTLVPDGARVALSVVDMATNDPSGDPILSDGGEILGGVTAANNPDFRIFTVSGGMVTAEYGPGGLVPDAILGALAVVQAMPVDDADNVLGNEAIGSFDLNVRADTDEAIVFVRQASLYGDRGARIAALRIAVRDETTGLPVPDGTQIKVSASSCSGRVAGLCVSSFGGTIHDPADPEPEKNDFVVANGEVLAEYHLPTSLSVNPGDVRFATIQVIDPFVAQRAMGTATIALVGPAGAEIDASPESLPLIRPEPPLQIRVRHVHDARGNLLPEGAKIIVSSQSCATRDAVSSLCNLSAGGDIVDGSASPSDRDLRVFTISNGAVHATYKPLGINWTAGDVKTAGIQVAMANFDGRRNTQTGVAYRAVPLVAPANAAAVADRSSVLADGRLRTSTITFSPVVDAYGNTLPDGSRVLASAKSNEGRLDGTLLPSVTGAQILNGDVPPSGNAHRGFDVVDGAVTVEFGIDGFTASAGDIRVANVVLLLAGPTDNIVDRDVLGFFPMQLPGVTSTTGMASTTVVEADGGDHRVMVTLSNFRDALGNPVPDGVKVGLTARGCGTTVCSQCVNPSAFPEILGGETTSLLGHKVFTIQSGQIVAEISTIGVSVSSGFKTAIIQAEVVSANNSVLSPRATLATVELLLVTPGPDRIAPAPVSLFANGGAAMSQITAAVGSVADGEQVALTASDGAADDGTTGIASAGGTIVGGASGTPASFRFFTVSGSEAAAAFSAAGLVAGVGETQIARVSVVPADGLGNVSSTMALATGEVRLRGMTCAVPSGVTRLSLTNEEDTTINFSGIRDAIGNIVPDGTIVLVSVEDGATNDSFGSPVASVGGTILNGDDSVEGPSFRAFTAISGRISVHYSSVGAASTGSARIQIAPAANDGTRIGDRSLLGGVHRIILN